MIFSQRSNVLLFGVKSLTARVIGTLCAGRNTFCISASFLATDFNRSVAEIVLLALDVPFGASFARRAAVAFGATGVEIRARLAGTRDVKLVWSLAAQSRASVATKSAFRAVFIVKVAARPAVFAVKDVARGATNAFNVGGMFTFFGVRDIALRAVLSEFVAVQPRRIAVVLEDDKLLGTNDVTCTGRSLSTFCEGIALQPCAAGSTHPRRKKLTAEGTFVQDEVAGLGSLALLSVFDASSAAFVGARVLGDADFVAFGTDSVVALSAGLAAHLMYVAIDAALSEEFGAQFALATD